jgi:hypothetical protein
VGEQASQLSVLFSRCCNDTFDASSCVEVEVGIFGDLVLAWTNAVYIFPRLGGFENQLIRRYSNDWAVFAVKLLRLLEAVALRAYDVQSIADCIVRAMAPGILQAGENKGCRRLFARNMQLAG